MRERKSEQKAIRTVRREMTKDLLAVLFFLLLLPYVCSVLMAMGEEKEDSEALVETSAQAVTDSADSSHYIRVERENGVWNLPMEEYLIGTLAGSIPGYYREETLKAQAVIMRSSGFCFIKENNMSEFSYLDNESRRQLWEDKYDEYEVKFTKAVRDTAGIVLMFEKEIISPPFFRLSAGLTRNSAQIWDDGYMGWCASVPCPHNLEAAEYLKTVVVRQNEFISKLEQEGIPLLEKGNRIKLVRDSAGYVLFVECGGKRIEGEQFRTLFELPSAHFTIREENEKIVVVTRGIGHGLGFDQYAADLLAGAGQDYQKLLNTFFTGVTLEKVE